MVQAVGYAVHGPKDPLVPFHFTRREPGPRDVEIQIIYCGICHSDLHQVRNEWNNAIYPMVPGHEIVGRVTRIGRDVHNFAEGDLAGVGCMVNSCRVCQSCEDGLENFCEKGWVGTYNSMELDGKTPTYGGYADIIVVDEAFTLRIPANLDLAGTAPLLCAGITTYSPLHHWGVGPGSKVGVVGLGGLGHMAVKIAHALGAHVTVFTSSPAKRPDALRLGADNVIISSDHLGDAQPQGSFDFILDTVSAAHDLNPYIGQLRRDGTLVMVGIPSVPPAVAPFPLIMGRRRIAGSLIGGIKETQEMLDFCAKHQIVSDIELIPIQKIEEAYERMVRGDVKYRFVIDLKTLAAAPTGK